MAWTIFEFYNVNRAELALGLTTKGVQDEWEKARKNLPSALGHWRLGDEDVSIHEVETFSDQKQAERFLNVYRPQLLRPGWKILILSP